MYDFFAGLQYFSLLDAVHFIMIFVVVFISCLIVTGKMHFKWFLMLVVCNFFYMVFFSFIG